jgi:putative transcriptional regulator
MSDGSERPFPHTPMRAMTEAEIEAAAAADPDARPMTPEELRTARRVPREDTAAGARLDPAGIRGALSYSPRHAAGFAVIAHDPEGARRAGQGSGSRED